MRNLKIVFYAVDLDSGEEVVPRSQCRLDLDEAPFKKLAESAAAEVDAIGLTGEDKQKILVTTTRMKRQQWLRELITASTGAAVRFIEMKLFDLLND
jgi:hypothetical protein